jgi:hypothetical protein
MFEGLTKRDIVIAGIGMIVAVALTLEGTYYGLHRFVLDHPNDPLAKQGGLKPEQKIVK